MLEYYEMCLVICQCYTYIINTVCNSYLHDIHTISVVYLFMPLLSTRHRRNGVESNGQATPHWHYLSMGRAKAFVPTLLITARLHGISLCLSHMEICLSSQTLQHSLPCLMKKEVGYVCMYVCVCACYIHIQQSSHACTHTYVCMYKCMCVCYRHTYCTYIHKYKTYPA